MCGTIRALGSACGAAAASLTGMARDARTGPAFTCTVQVPR
jgi:hypothetical protein